MRRTTFGKLPGWAGVSLGIVLLAVGGLLLWGSAYVHNTVPPGRPFRMPATARARRGQRRSVTTDSCSTVRAPMARSIRRCVARQRTSSRRGAGSPAAKRSTAPEL
jgi:hypothetical protein